MSNDIKMISENYSLAKDRVQWVLTEHYKAKDKDDSDVIRTRPTYHSTLRQVANYLVDNNEYHTLEKYILKAEHIKSQIESLLAKPNHLIDIDSEVK